MIHRETKYHNPLPEEVLQIHPFQISPDGGLESTVLDMSIVEKVLHTDKKYYHCCNDGIIFANEDYTIPLIDLKALTGRPQIPKELNKYYITSGYCLSCELKVFI